MFLKTKSIFLFILYIRNGSNKCNENERMKKKEGKSGKRMRKGSDQTNKKRAKFKRRTGSIKTEEQTQ